MKTKITFTPADAHKIAQLANIPITHDEEKNLAIGFTEVIKVVEQLNIIDTENVESTHQVTGLNNVFREDVIDSTRMFSQQEALKNAKQTHNGFFIIDQILDTGDLG